MRIDSAALLVKDPNLGEELAESGPGEHPYQDRDQLHDIYRHWRSIANEYDEARVLVGEIWLPDAERFARYLRPDELHIAFNFDFLACPWEAGPMRTSIDSTLAVHAPVGAPATWVLSNHDVTRPVTRYGRADTSFAFQSKRAGTPTDLERGTRRGRAAALLAMALPGSMYIYQGEELGLPEVEDIPDERRQDPMWVRSGGVDPGRDGCRVPMPWTGDQAPYGFSRPGAERPWLDPPDDWAQLTVEAQSEDATSMLALYRDGLRLRRSRPLVGRLDAALASLVGLGARVHARRELHLHRQFRSGARRAAARCNHPHRQQRARRRCIARRHDGLASRSRREPGDRCTAHWISPTRIRTGEPVPKGRE